MVEMALVTPFLIILALGIFEFGNLLYGHQLITTGIRDAGRWLARVPARDLTLTPPVLGPDDTVNHAKATQIALTGEIVGGTKRVSWWYFADIVIDTTSGDIPNPILGTGERAYRGGDPIKIIQVSTTVSYNGLGYLNFLGIGPTLDFSLSHEERYMGR